LKSHFFVLKWLRKSKILKHCFRTKPKTLSFSQKLRAPHTGIDPGGQDICLDGKSSHLRSKQECNKKSNRATILWSFSLFPELGDAMGYKYMSCCKINYLSFLESPEWFAWSPLKKTTVSAIRYLFVNTVR